MSSPIIGWQFKYLQFKLLFFHFSSHTNHAQQTGPQQQHGCGFRNRGRSLAKTRHVADRKTGCTKIHYGRKIISIENTPIKKCFIINQCHIISVLNEVIFRSKAYELKCISRRGHACAIRIHIHLLVGHALIFDCPLRIRIEYRINPKLFATWAPQCGSIISCVIINSTNVGSIN